MLSSVIKGQPTEGTPSRAPSHRGRRREKLSETIAREIVHDIVERDLPAGTVLQTEAEMFETFGAGRASVREALRLLEANGLIAIKTGLGPIVAQASSVDFAKTAALFYHANRATFGELVEARNAVEPMMAAFAARRRSPETETALRDSLDRARTAEQAGDDRAYLEHNSEFHGIIAGLSGNRVLDLFGGALKHLYYERMWDVTEMHVPGDVVQAHEKVANAIIAGDAGLAQALMAKHMDDIYSRLSSHSLKVGEQLVDWR